MTGEGAAGGAGEGAVYEFRMPSLGADMEAGTLMRWLVEPGARVRRGDIVAVVDTEKADIEIEIFRGGVIEELVVREGEKVPVGTVLVRLSTAEAAAEEARAAAEAPPSAAGAPARAEAVPPAPPPGAEAPPRAEVRPAAPPAAAVAPAAPPPPPAARAGAPAPASPAARKRARELGLDLASVAGSGPGGAIRLADVERAAAPPPRARVHAVARKVAESLGVDLAEVTGTGAGGAITKADVERAAAARTPAGGLRRALAAAMERANRDIPHYYLSLDIDLSPTLSWLEGENRRRPVTERLLPAALLLKAVALAARRVPEVNGFWIDGAFRPGEGIHLGVAIARRGGEVVVPAIHDADALDLSRLMAALKSLVERARAGSLRSSEVADATLTVTNLGDLGADSVHGVIFPPQVALVGFGRIAERPWAEGGLLGVRPVVTATLAADHRASDGYRGGRFLAAIDALLREPETL